MINVILCGGSGTRLWPLSRKLMPKQFIKIFGNKSLFQLTVKRNAKICEQQFIVSNKDQYFSAQDQLLELKQNNNRFLLEGVGRDTAPAITLACMSLNADDIVLITPSDHLIKNEDNYQQAINRAKQLAEQNYLTTFGVNPTYAETGFGYIEADGESVLSFCEKPDKKTAEGYINSGNYYWNSGMFCFKAGVFLAEIKKYANDIYFNCQAVLNNIDKNQSILNINQQDMLKIPEDSIDYAVMEKSNKVKIVPMDANWSDVGSFESLAKELPNDENNNLIISEKLVKTIDIKDSVIVDTGDVLLISDKKSTQKVKDIVGDLKKQNSDLVNIGLIGYRPWGSYNILDENDGYKIKRIEVLPHKRLSLQSHKHRNEHWVVIKGIATITLNDDEFELSENESTYIKAGDKHRLANNTNEPLIIIESQVGSYTGEDDIERFDDDFNRNK